MAHPRSGFTLLEVMIATVVLILLTVSAALASVSILKSYRVSNEVAAAAVAAQQVLEVIQTVPFSSVTEIYPPDTQVPAAQLNKGSVEIAYDDPAALPLMITVTVRWVSPDVGAMERVFATARMD